MDFSTSITAVGPRAMAIQQDASPLAKRTPEQEKLHESCKQFEAIIWRSVLEKSSQSMFGGEESSSDKTGTYQYFANNSMANAVSGLPSSFSSILYAQLASHLPAGSSPTNPS